MFRLELAPFTDRNRFFKLLHDRGLLGEVAEIGVLRADWSHLFLTNWRGRLLHAIDPWQQNYDPEDPASGFDMAEAKEYARQRLIPHHGKGRVQYHVMASLAAVQRFGERQLDMVYVDGCHQYDAVKADLAAWWPKIKSGGILAGHDYLCPGEHAGGWGRHVQPAVNAFAVQHGLIVYLVMEEAGMPWSYYLEKP